LQLIHDARSGLHHAVSMPQQLPHIPCHGRTSPLLRGFGVVVLDL